MVLIRLLIPLVYLFTDVALASTAVAQGQVIRSGAVLIHYVGANEISPAKPEVLFEEFKRDCPAVSDKNCFYLVSASSTAGLISELENLEIPEDVAIAKVLILAHGQSGIATRKTYELNGQLTDITPINFISFGGSDPLVLHIRPNEAAPNKLIVVTDSVDDYDKLETAFEPLRARMADEVEVMCTSCKILTGDPQLVKEKIATLGRLLAIKNGRLYANSTYGYMNGTIFRPPWQLNKPTRAVNFLIYVMVAMVSGTGAIMGEPAAVLLGPALILGIDLGAATIFNRGYEAEFKNTEVETIKPQKAELFLKRFFRQKSCNWLLRPFQR